MSFLLGNTCTGKTNHVAGDTILVDTVLVTILIAFSFLFLKLTPETVRGRGEPPDVLAAPGHNRLERARRVCRVDLCGRVNLSARTPQYPADCVGLD